MSTKPPQLEPRGLPKAYPKVGYRRPWGEVQGVEEGVDTLGEGDIDQKTQRSASIVWAKKSHQAAKAATRVPTDMALEMQANANA
jgi:hypothetical protein